MNTLTLLQLEPDLAAVNRWIVATGQSNLNADLGYGLHAATRAALGGLAPKPFALQRNGQSSRLVGYVAAPPDAIGRAISLQGLDCDVADALRLSHWKGRELPQDWRPGERLRFEVHAAPIVRTRTAMSNAYVEQDAAFHPKFGQDATDAEPPTREETYGRWLANELARGNAAALLHHELISFSYQSVLRRHATNAAGKRPARSSQLPATTFRGLLEVRDGAAFHALIARGLGRHRAFGFGCLLLAPA